MPALIRTSATAVSAFNTGRTPAMRANKRTKKKLRPGYEFGRKLAINTAIARKKFPVIKIE